MTRTTKGIVRAAAADKQPRAVSRHDSPEDRAQFEKEQPATRNSAAIQDSEIRYRRLFEAARDGILILDPDTRKITDANPFMTELLGYPHQELVGKELWEIGLLKDEKASRVA